MQALPFFASFVTVITAAGSANSKMAAEDGHLHLSGAAVACVVPAVLASSL
jgi:hypothetical protein